VSRALRRLLAAAALLAALPAAAAEGWEQFFTPFLGDLRAEAADAGKAGKAGVLLMFHFDECPYCAKMKAAVLSRPEVQRYFQERFAAVAIDTRGAQVVSDLDGAALPEKEIARKHGVRATPTFQFYAPDGTLLATQAGAIFDPVEFMLLGDYVASGAYRNASFAAFKQSRQKRGS